MRLFTDSSVPVSLRVRLPFGCLLSALESIYDAEAARPHVRTKPAKYVVRIHDVVVLIGTPAIDVFPSSWDRMNGITLVELSPGDRPDGGKRLAA